MRKVLLPLMTGLALVASVVAVAPASHADPDAVTVTARATPVEVRKGRCASTHVRARGNWEWFEDATATVVVRDPRGRKVAEATFTNRRGEIDRSLRICRPAEGVHTAAVRVVAVDEAGDRYVGHDTALFRVRHIAPKKRSRLVERHGRVSGQGRYKFAAVGTLYRDGALYERQRVWLIAKIGRSWYKIDRSTTGHRGRSRGRVGWLFKPNSERWAFYFAGNDRTRPSVSDPFRFGSGRRTATTAAGSGRLGAVRSLVVDRR